MWVILVSSLQNNLPLSLKLFAIIMVTKKQSFLVFLRQITYKQYIFYFLIAAHTSALKLNNLADERVLLLACGKIDSAQRSITVQFIEILKHCTICFTIKFCFILKESSLFIE